MRSKQIPNLLISSSGTHAAEQQKGSITWYGQRLLYRYNLLSYASNSWCETTFEHISKADNVIFMSKYNYEYCTQKFLIPKKYEIWNLADFDDKDLNGKPLNIARETEFIIISEKTFFLIRENIDKFILGFINKTNKK